MFDDDSIKPSLPSPLYILANNYLTITRFEMFTRYSNDSPKYPKYKTLHRNVSVSLYHQTSWNNCHFHHKTFRTYKISFDVGNKTPLPSIDSQRPSNSTSIATSVPAWEFTRPPTRRELTRWRRTYKRTSIVHHPPLEDSVAYINPFVPPFPTIKYSNSSSDRVPRYKTFARAPLSEVLCSHSHRCGARPIWNIIPRHGNQGRGNNFNPWNDGRVAKGGKVRLII